MLHANLAASAASSETSLSCISKWTASKTPLYPQPDPAVYPTELFIDPASRTDRVVFLSASPNHRDFDGAVISVGEKTRSEGHAGLEGLARKWKKSDHTMADRVPFSRLNFITPAKLDPADQLLGWREPRRSRELGSEWFSRPISVLLVPRKSSRLHRTTHVLDAMFRHVPAFQTFG